MIKNPGSVHGSGGGENASSFTMPARLCQNEMSQARRSSHIRLVTSYTQETLATLVVVDDS